MACAFFLVWALWPHRYGYFEALRLGVLAVCAFGVYCARVWKREGWIWAFGFLAVLFNPLVKIALGRQTWKVVDVVVAAFLIASIFLLRQERPDTLGIDNDSGDSVRRRTIADRAKAAAAKARSEEGQ